MAYQIGLCDDELYQIKVNGLFLKEIASKNDMDIVAQLSRQKSKIFIMN